MKFQVDAHISTELVSMIRGLGFDCADASTIPLRSPDVEVLTTAAAEGRIVMTNDKDFGELVFAHSILSPGVILIRLPFADEAQRVAHIQKVWPVVISRLPGAFITITLSGIRVRPIPESPLPDLQEVGKP